MHQSGMELGEIVAFSLLMLGNLAMALPLSVFPAILDGLERFASKSAVRIVFLALRTAATIVLMERTPSLMGLGIIFAVGNLAENAVMAALCWAQLPRLRFSVRLIDRATLKAVKGYSIDAFLAMIAGRVSVQSGAIVVGIFLGAAEVAWFAIALRLVEFAKAFLRSATMTLTPAISSLDAAGNVEAIRQVLFKGTRWVLYLIIPVHLGLIVFGRPFLSIWLGSPEYGDRCYPALVILSGTLSLVVATSVASRILYGMGLLRRFSRASLLEAAVNLSLSLVLARRLGIVGVAWASALPNLLFCLFAIGYTCKLLSASGREYAGKAWLRPLAAGLAPLAVWSSGWTTNGWLGLGLAIGAGLLPYALLVLLLEKAPLRRAHRGRAMSILSRAMNFRKMAS
jgi:O-antigen/teichoic acid export membrane protein